MGGNPADRKSEGGLYPRPHASNPLAQRALKRVQAAWRPAPKMHGLSAYTRLMVKAESKSHPASVPATYEAALAELEQLVGDIESGDFPLEKMLSGYQRGAELLKFCRDRLAMVENQIKVLDNGMLKPWTPE